jgi:hypothetical protein
MIKTPKASLIQTGETNFVRVISKNQTEGELQELPENETISGSNFKFLDLFWFHTPKNETSKSNQLELVTLNLNLNFGNLRINGYLDIKNTIHNQAIFLTKDLLTVNTAIYPSALFHIRNMRNKDRYQPIEQLFVPYDPENEPWHNDLAISEFVKRDDQLLMQIDHRGNNYFYIFKDRQYQLFNYALDFVLTKGLTLVGMKK